MFFNLPAAVAAVRKGGWWQTVATWLQAGICLALWPWMIPRWGLLGAAFGSLVAQIAATLLLGGLVHARLLHLSIGRFAREALLPAFAAACVLIAIVWPLRVRVTGWISFFALCAAAGACYTIVFWRLLPGDDRRFLRAKLPI